MENGTEMYREKEGRRTADKGRTVIFGFYVDRLINLFECGRVFSGRNCGFMLSTVSM